MRLVESALAFKALLQVRLYSEWVFGFGEDFEHLVVGEEEESRKEETLLFEVSVEAFVDLVEEIVAVDQLLQKSSNRCCLDDLQQNNYT